MLDEFERISEQGPDLLRIQTVRWTSSLEELDHRIVQANKLSALSQIAQNQISEPRSLLRIDSAQECVIENQIHLGLT